MSSSWWKATTWELPWSFLHGPVNDRLLGTWEAMVAGSLLYLVVLAALSYWTRDRRNAKPPQPFSITPYVLLQNFVMAIYSGYVFIGAFLVLWENTKRPGFSWLHPICDPTGNFKKGMDYWFYHFYLSKFVEWFDTIFLLLRAKPVFPPSNSQYFLHVFHHMVTPSIVWYAWRVQFSVAWIGPVSNGFVHVFMYSYYFLTDLGMNRRFGGMLITPIQIIQFVIALTSIAYESIYFKECGSDPFALGWMWFTYAVFLSLFIKLYFDKAQERSSSSTRPTPHKPKPEEKTQ